MQNKLETIGIVDWYNSEKGYGVLKNLHDQRDYFIHHSKLAGQYKHLLNKGDIVKFAPNYDQRRNREVATDVRYLNKLTDLQWAIKIWIEDDYITDSCLGKLFSFYFNYFDKDESASFVLAHNKLIASILPYSENGIVFKKIYLLIKSAILSSFEQKNSLEIVELTDLLLLEKVPAKDFILLLDTIKSPYICFHFALNSSEYESEAINHAIKVSNKNCDLLDDLIRFAKDINDENVQDSLNHNKNLITNNLFWEEICGCSIISHINKFLFTALNHEELKALVKQGYIDVDNNMLMIDNPDAYKRLTIDAYNEGWADDIDISFIESNINEFTVSGLIKIKQKYKLSEENASKIYLCMTRYFLANKIEVSVKDINLLSQEIPDLNKWICDNRSILADKAEIEFDNLKISIYKNKDVNVIDE